MKKTIYSWDEDTGVATCSIFYQDKEYKGQAICHQEDKDFQSRLIGSDLAYLRACIKLLQGIKQSKRDELKGVKSVYYSLTPSPRFNPNSFETHMIKQRIEELEEDIEVSKSLIQNLQTQIKKSIDTSDEFYKSVRKDRERRAKAQTEN